MKLMRTTIFLVLAIAALGAVGVTTAIMSSGPTPAYAAQKSGPCPNSSYTCITGGSGSGIAGGGGGGHVVINPETGDFTGSGGVGHQGGFHESGNRETGQFSCVGSICPPTHP